MKYIITPFQETVQSAEYTYMTTYIVQADPDIYEEGQKIYKTIHTKNYGDVVLPSYDIRCFFDGFMNSVNTDDHVELEWPNIGKEKIEEYAMLFVKAALADRDFGHMEINEIRCYLDVQYSDDETINENMRRNILIFLGLDEDKQ